MLCFYQGTYGERISQSLESIKRIAPFVDRTIIIVDETVTEEQRQQLGTLGCEVYLEPWQDSMVKMRNAALNKIQTDDWVITADPDEFFNETFCRNVKDICKKAEEQGLELLLINSHDTTIKADGTKDSSVSDFFKNLIYRKVEGTHYEGVGEVKEVHEILIIPGITKTAQLPKEKYWYDHIKYWHEVWERAMRNVFMGGGGNNAGNRNPSWKPLRDLFSEIGIENWTQARQYLRYGDIDPRLKEWFWDNRTEGFDFDHEEMEGGRWFFECLHPEEAKYPDGREWKPILVVPKGSPAEVMGYVEDTYMHILGRHADQEGKEAYTKAIIEGMMKRETLSEILKQSDEYRQKLSLEQESIRLNVPVSVDLKMSEDLFVQALMRSKTYWEKIKPCLEIGKYIRTELGEEGWIKFQKWFYKEQHLTLKKLSKKLGEAS